MSNIYEYMLWVTEKCNDLRRNKITVFKFNLHTIWMSIILRFMLVDIKQKDSRSGLNMSEFVSTAIKNYFKETSKNIFTSSWNKTLKTSRIIKSLYLPWCPKMPGDISAHQSLKDLIRVPNLTKLKTERT